MNFHPYVTKILFICHGNICRSPMAEFVMKDLVSKAGLADRIEVASAAVSMEEIGNDMYPPAKRKLREKSIPFTPRAARRITKADYEYYDRIICMDQSNLRWLRHLFPDTEITSSGKVSLLLNHDVADPWYTGDFEATYQDLVEGCTTLLRACL